MLCLRVLRSLASAMRPLPRTFESKSSLTKRTITTHTLTRPSPFISRSLCRRHNAPTGASNAVLLSNSPSTGCPVNILPKISSHLALAGIQVRNGPRNTFDPSHRVRKRRCGFLARKRSRTGRMILKRRRLKGRSTLSH